MQPRNDKKSPMEMGDSNLWLNTVLKTKFVPEAANGRWGSAAAHAIAAIEAFVAGAAADRDMTAGVASRGVALHAPGSRVDGIQPVIGSDCGGQWSRRPGGLWLGGA